MALHSTSQLSSRSGELGVEPFPSFLRREEGNLTRGWTSGMKFHLRPLSNVRWGGPTRNGSRRILVLAATPPVRWNLDDVERLSRGHPSKAKMGSRAVPHRLNAKERKAFELAKKRGYVVQQANTRRYPLINTYRNYCDALCFPCIRIEQRPAGFPDEVVIDLTPLRLPEADVSTLRDEVLNAVTTILAMTDEERSLEFIPEVDTGVDQVEDHHESRLTVLESEKELTSLDGLEDSTEPLRVQASSRNMAKLIGRTALDTWTFFTSSNARRVAG